VYLKIDLQIYEYVQMCKYCYESKSDTEIERILDKQLDDQEFVSYQVCRHGWKRIDCAEES